jgi:PAS domain S-box-containing protein
MDGGAPRGWWGAQLSRSNDAPHPKARAPLKTLQARLATRTLPKSVAPLPWLAVVGIFGGGLVLGMLLIAVLSQLPIALSDAAAALIGGTAIVGVVAAVLYPRWLRQRALLVERARTAEVFQTVLESIPLAAVLLDRDGRITFANQSMTAMSGWSRAALEGHTWSDRLVKDDEAAAWHRRFSEAMRDSHHLEPDENDLVTSTGAVRLVRWSSAVLRDSSGAIAGVARLGEDVTEATRLRSDQRRLSTAVEQSAEAVIISEPDGAIRYVNPAYERLSGYGRDEVIGHNPRLVNSGLQPPGFYRAMWDSLTAGRVWRGEMTNRRKDGTLYRQIATISPVRAEDGTITSYVGVQHDITRERELEGRMEREIRERAAVVAALERLAPDASLEAGASAICAELIAIPGVTHAVICSFDEQAVMPLAVAGPPGLDLKVNRRIPAHRARYLRSRSEAGPWVASWGGDLGSGYGFAATAAGVLAVAYIPLRRRGRTFGLLALTATHADDAEQLEARLPALADFGAVASSRLAPAALGPPSDTATRSRVEALIRDRAFTPHFQPVIDLASGAVAGYEALARFSDGMPPDVAFDTARRVDLGVELEEVVLAASMVAAEALPPHGWLAVNVSPELVLAADRLARAIGATDRELVLEVTEHTEIDNYTELHEAVAGLGREVRLSVDDAGAGFASMRHIVELQPDFVKLDIGLVRSIDTDPLRRAMVAGLGYFAQQAGCALIAEGIETEAELAAVRALNVRFGQGFLLGKPAPGAAWTLTAPRDRARRRGSSRVAQQRRA